MLELEKSGTAGAVDDDKEFAWGAFVGGVIPTFGDDSLQLNFTYGDGVGRYLINGDAQDGFVNSSGKLKTIEHWGIAAAYTHHWTDTWYSNVAYGREEFEDTFAPSDSETLQTIHVNTYWQPADNVRFGLEWIYGRRGRQDDDLDNDANRIQFGGQYFF